MVTASIAPAPDLTSDASTRTLQPTLTAKKLRRLWFVVFIVQLLYTFQLVMMAAMYIRTSWRAYVPFLTFLTETFLVTNERRFITHYATLIGATFGDFSSASTQTRRPQGRLASQVHALWIRYGIRGERFEEGLVVREGIEMLLQTTQVYATSKTISSTVVNQSFSVLIALSAVMHPIISRLYGGQVAKKRIACVLADFLLDIMWATILPLCVFLKYWSLDRTMTAEQVMGAFEYGYYEKAQREIRHLVILSWWQFLLAIFPAISALLNLRSTMRLLSVALIVESDRVPLGPDVGLLRLGPSGPAPPSKPGLELLADLSTDQRKSVFAQRGRRLITFTGIAVCIASIAAMGLFESPGRLEDSSYWRRLYPWFVSDDACVVIFLDCIELNISGHQDELHLVLDTVHVLLAYSSYGIAQSSPCPQR